MPAPAPLVKVILFGATGMVGAGVLAVCLEDPRVESVVVVGRRPCGRAHAKLREILRTEFFDYRDVAEDLKQQDA